MNQFFICALTIKQYKLRENKKVTYGQSQIFKLMFNVTHPDFLFLKSFTNCSYNNILLVSLYCWNNYLDTNYTVIDVLYRTLQFNHCSFISKNTAVKLTPTSLGVSSNEFLMWTYLSNIRSYFMYSILPCNMHCEKTHGNLFCPLFSKVNVQLFNIYALNEKVTEQLLISNLYIYI